MKLSLALLLSLLFSQLIITSASANPEQNVTKTKIANSILSPDQDILTLSRLIFLPLEDGVQKTESSEVTQEDTITDANPEKLSTSPYISLTLPVAALDRNVDYTLTVSSIKPSSQYNIAYIIDTSSNMNGQELQDVKNAYISLTNDLVDSDTEVNINFAVISFDQQVTSRRNLTAQEAIASIQKLQISSSSQAKYNQALEESYKFIEQSPLDKSTTPNIVYFSAKKQSLANESISDVDKYRQSIIDLQKHAHIKAFGIKNNLDNNNKFISQKLNLIDSDQAVLLNNSSDFTEAIQKTELSESIAEIKIYLGDNIVDKIKPEQLTETSLGLIFKGSIDGLDIRENAENIVTAEVVFKNDLPKKSINFTVTSGHGTIAVIESQPDSTDDILKNILHGSNRDDEIVLAYTDLGANGNAGSDRIIANRRDNILNGGEGNDTINAHEGNDTIHIGEDSDRIDGGEGIDTIVYQDKSSQSRNFLKVGKILIVDHADNLTNVEFIQFSDVRISTETLKVVPILKGKQEINVKEGNSLLTTAQLTFELSTPTSADVKFDYKTMAPEGYPLEAILGRHYIAKSGQVTIPAGETKAIIELEIIGDTVDEEQDFQTFVLHLSKISGATFEENQTEFDIVIDIEDDDNALRIKTGDNTYTDSLGQQWIPGEGWGMFKNGQTNLTSNQISQTDDDILYQSEYFGKNFSFNFPISGSSCPYEVTLRFAETAFDQPKQRIFDVLIEDRLVLDDFDIFATAEGTNIPTSKTFEVQVTDHYLDINFLASMDNAKISAVEIKPKSPDITGCLWF
ncbi:MAG: malectin domain-containing carbohydrate-binding protein [Waterburya sp.]